jgi:uncharacterized membrane protein YhaH (DUF805 family)
MTIDGSGTQARGEQSASSPMVWAVAAAVALLGGVLLAVSALVTIASGDGFSFSLWDFWDISASSPTGDGYLDDSAPWIVGVGIYVVVLSLLVMAMTVRGAAPGLRRALSYTQGLGGIASFGVTVAILRLDIWGFANVTPSVLFSLLAFGGSLLIAAGGVTGAFAGISGSREEGRSLWLFSSVRGRISRQGWWVAYIAFVAFLLASGYTLAVITVWLLIPWYLGALYVAICIDGKRWHDRGRSAWWVALYVIPLVGPIWMLVELGFLRGTPGPNRYGEGHRELEV